MAHALQFAGSMDLDEQGRAFLPEEARDPRIVDRYCIRRQVAEGGMGRIFEATRRSDGRRVAVKILRRELGHCERSRRLVLREAHALARASHARIVELFCYGETSTGLPFLVLEWLEGRSLHEALGEDGPFSMARVRTLYAQLLDGLEVLHARGIVHSDVKPENCMLVRSRDGREELRLVDFGVSSLDEDLVGDASEVHGTPGYLPPEVLRGDPPSPASDLYAAGVVLYELLTGCPPFVMGSLHQLVRAQQHEPPPPPSELRPGASPALDMVVARALSPDPAQRFADVHALREAFLAAVVPPTSHWGVPSAQGHETPGVIGA